jgi:hypothetical protein
MTLIRKKIPKSGYILLALLAVGLIALPIVHFTGLYDVSFLGDWATEAAMVASTSGWIAGGIAVGCSAVGFGVCYILKDYIIGMEGNSTNLTVTSGTGYTAPGQTLSQSDPVVS